MENKDFLAGNIGAVGGYSLGIKENKLAVEVYIGPKEVLELVKKMIPGDIDDAIINGLEKALGLA